MTVWTVWLFVVMVHSSGGGALIASVTSSTLLVKQSDADPGQYVWTAPVLTGEMEFIPFGSVEAGAEPMIAPQNRLLQKPPGTVYEWFSETGRGKTVVVGNHYSRGADLWLTQDAWGGLTSVVESLPNIFNIGAASGVMDRVSKSMAVRWLEKKKGEYLEGGKFSDLFVYYTGGVDHAGHDKGLRAYRQAFLEVTDPEAVAQFVDKLKEIGEFYNKVFLITSDHGHTEMAAPESVILYAGTADERSVAPDVSCSYKLKGFNKQGATRDAELANNNLHVWELGEVLRKVQTVAPDLNYRMLAPVEVAELFLDSPAGAVGSLGSANVVAALNGPMAHIYLKGPNGWNDTAPDPNELLKLAGVFDLIFRKDDPAVAEAALGVDSVDYLNLVKNTVGRLKRSVDQIVVRVAGTHYLFPGYDANGRMQLLTGVDLDASQYVKAAERIAGMNHTERSGDIVLLFKSDVNNISDRYTSGVSCKSWHGSLNRTDSYVPFILSYPGGNAAELDKPIEAVCSNKQCAGNRKATDLIKKIVETQYSGQ